jgi:hypothetical protein
MTPTQKIKEEYLDHIRKLLYDYPDVLRTFEQLWQTGKLREAYLCVDEAVRKLGIALSPEQRKVDEAFYWEVVN